MPGRVGARPKALIKLAEDAVSEAFDPALLGDAKTDLYRLAAARRVHTVVFRPLLADGCLIVDDSGFAIQISDDKQSTIRMGTDMGQYRLTVKQRFTFAHEIGHTLPYDISSTPPRPKPGMISAIAERAGREAAQSVEGFCQIAAGLLLLPLRGLRRHLGKGGAVDSLDVLLKIAATFRVSPEVAIHRIDMSDSGDGLKSPDIDLLMVRTKRGKEEIRACLHAATLRGIVDRPRLYSSVGAWLKRTPVLKEWNIMQSAEGVWEKHLRGGVLRVAKRPYDLDSHFLEIRYRPSLGL